MYEFLSTSFLKALGKQGYVLKIEFYMVLDSEWIGCKKIVLPSHLITEATFFISLFGYLNNAITKLYPAGLTYLRAHLGMALDTVRND